MWRVPGETGKLSRELRYPAKISFPTHNFSEKYLMLAERRCGGNVVSHNFLENDLFKVFCQQLRNEVNEI